MVRVGVKPLGPPPRPARRAPGPVRRGDTGRYRETPGDTGRYREIQGDLGRCVTPGARTPSTGVGLGGGIEHESDAHLVSGRVSFGLGFGFGFGFGF